MAIIAISRGTLHGGQALAELAARQLGYPIVSREQIVSSTEWYAIPAGTGGASGEVLGSYWDRLAGERKAYQESFQAAICERARRGNLVYHGHAVHLLMPGIPTLKVRVVADMDYRIAAVTRDHGLSKEDAAAYIQKVDRERAEWTHYLYGVDWENPNLYDVVLNVSHISLDAACSTVVHLARMGEFKIKPEGLREMENCSLKARVNAALARDGRTTGAQLKIRTEDGVVTVEGTAAKEVVEAVPSLVATVDGVRNVKNYVQAIG